jgi:predicted HD superfamily hydrolase involved in NAD metabolism
MWRQIDFLKEKLLTRVSEKRYLHSLEVANYAVELAKRFNADPVKAEAIGILHDYCKDWESAALAEFIKTHSELPNDLLEHNEELWHGPVASIVIQEELEITDPEIISAVRYHTTGRVQMSDQEKIICLADYIEPNRNFDGVEQIRLLAEHDLNLATLAVFDGAINFLLRKKSRIYPLTLEARNYLLSEIEQEQDGNTKINNWRRLDEFRNS